MAVFEENTAIFFGIFIVFKFSKYVTGEYNATISG
jgi:hypothetical protein